MRLPAGGSPSPLRLELQNRCSARHAGGNEVTQPVGARTRVEQAVATDIHPCDQDERDDRPRQYLPAPGEVRRDEAGQRGRHRGVTRNEALARLGTFPRVWMAPIEVPGRSRLTTPFTARSNTSFATVASNTMTARRNRRMIAATTATIGPTTMVPTCWNGQSTGYSAPGRSFTARKTSSSTRVTDPCRTAIMPKPSIVMLATTTIASAGRRTKRVL